MPALPPGRFDDLAVFLAVADAGSLAAAARALAVDPSTVSRRVGRLEEDLGIALFQRTGQGMAVSEAGRRLAERLRPAMALVELGLDEALQPPDRLQGLIRVTAPTEIGSEFLVPVVQRFLEAHPHVDIALELSVRTLELGRREADLALRTHRPERGDVVTRRLAAAALVAVRAPSADPEQARRRFVAFPAPDPLVDPLVATLPDARVVLRSNDLAGLRAACIAGLGAAVLPEPLVKLHDLVPLDGFEPFAGAPMWLAAPSTSLELPRVRALWDAVVEGWSQLAEK